MNLLKIIEKESFGCPLNMGIFVFSRIIKVNLICIVFIEIFGECILAALAVLDMFIYL